MVGPTKDQILDITRLNPQTDSIGSNFEKIKRMNFLNLAFRWFVHLITFKRIAKNPQLDDTIKKVVTYANKSLANIALGDAKTLAAAVSVLQQIRAKNLGSQTSENELSSCLKELSARITKLQAPKPPNPINFDKSFQDKLAGLVKDYEANSGEFSRKLA